MSKESCYGCDYFFPIEELEPTVLDGVDIKLCPECLAK